MVRLARSCLKLTQGLPPQRWLVTCYIYSVTFTQVNLRINWTRQSRFDPRYNFYLCIDVYKKWYIYSFTFSSVLLAAFIFIYWSFFFSFLFSCLVSCLSAAQPNFTNQTEPGSYMSAHGLVKVINFGEEWPKKWKIHHHGTKNTQNTSGITINQCFLFKCTKKKKGFILRLLKHVQNSEKK